jgi:hypothetical protein
MTSIRLRYINEYRDRHGKLRRYFRRPGSRTVPLPGLPGSIEFMAAYQAALAVKAPPPSIAEARNRRVTCGHRRRLFALV